MGLLDCPQEGPPAIPSAAFSDRSVVSACDNFVLDRLADEIRKLLGDPARLNVNAKPQALNPKPKMLREGSNAMRLSYLGLVLAAVVVPL